MVHDAMTAVGTFILLPERAFNRKPGHFHFYWLFISFMGCDQAFSDDFMIQKLEEEVRVRGFSPKTIKA